jgi:hypothetical protein
MEMCKYLFLMILVLLISCTQDNNPGGDLNGTYIGTYLESGNLHDTAAVKIVFVGSNFSGESTGSLRPICNGSYLITGDSINFKNFCSTPDPELLLSGNYMVSAPGDSLYFTRIFTGTINYKEQFSLHKQ